MTETDAGIAHATGLFASLRNFAATLTAVAQTRLELLANEVEAEKLRFGQLLLFGSIALFCLAVGSVFLAIFVTVLLWDSHRLWVLGGLAVLYFSLGGAAVVMFRARASAGSRLFAASLAELDKDRQQLLP
jgi:uncharacterized membrane protein YqjE